MTRLAVVPLVRVALLLPLPVDDEALVALLVLEEGAEERLDDKEDEEESAMESAMDLAGFLAVVLTMVFGLAAALSFLAAAAAAAAVASAVGFFVAAAAALGSLAAAGFFFLVTPADFVRRLGTADFAAEGLGGRGGFVLDLRWRELGVSWFGLVGLLRKRERGRGRKHALHYSMKYILSRSTIRDIKTRGDRRAFDTFCLIDQGAAEKGRLSWKVTQRSMQNIRL